MVATCPLIVIAMGAGFVGYTVVISGSLPWDRLFQCALHVPVQPGVRSPRADLKVGDNVLFLIPFGPP
jgi:hypothetical protein